MNSPGKFAYPVNSGGRDLRLDFLRGLIMLVVIVVHMEYFSLFSLFAWERIGYVSSAEGFVVLSGIVLGIVYKKRLVREGFKSTAIKLWKRAFQLYRINVIVILSIALLRFLTSLDVFAVSHWVPIAQPDVIFSLYPPETTPWQEILRQALLLKIGPHQFQVIGLYVGLMAVAPLILFCLYRQQALLLILASWLLFLINQQLQLRVTGAGFEWGFPLLTWQLLFINGMMIGYHHENTLGYIAGDNSKVLIFFAGFVSLVFLMLALVNPNAVFWPWQSFYKIDASSFHKAYMLWLYKPTLGIGRIINLIALFIVFYALLSHYWKPISKAFGWLLIPLGQASLYVFVLHVYFIILVSNTPLPEYGSFFINTAIHAGTILLIWGMVKYRVLFQIIPR